MAERETDAAEQIMRNPFAERHLDEFLAGTLEGRRRESLLEWLSMIREHHQGLRALLLDRQMNVRLAFPEDKDYFGPIAQTYALEALHENRVVISDLHRSQYSGEVHLDLAIPLRAGGASPASVAPPGERDGQPPVAVVVVEVDPNQFLYPQIQHWPTPSPSSECLLVRREGDEVLYLNNLRHDAEAALSLRLPVNDGSLPAAAAARGQEGLVEGADYRKVPVLACVRGVPGTPWFLVAKVDQAEIDAPLRGRGWTTAALVTIVVLLTALWLGYLGRRHDNHWLRQQLNIERETRNSEERYRVLFASSRDAIMTLAPQSRMFLSANAAALEMFAVKDEAEFTSLGPWNLSPERQPDGRISDEKGREMTETAMREGSHCFEFTQKRLTGDEFPATVLLTRMELNGETFLQATVRRRHRAEAGGGEAAEDAERDRTREPPDAGSRERASWN